MVFRIMKAAFVSVAFLILSSIISYAVDVPNSEKRIYHIDVTASMVGRGRSKSADIFSTVKDNLITSIEHISDPNTEVVIIPFTSKPYALFTAYYSKKDSLVSMCRDLSVLPIAKVRIRYEDTNCARYVVSGDEGVQTLACKELAKNRRFMKRIAAL